MAVQRLVCFTSSSADVLADRPDVEVPRDDSDLSAACTLDALPNHRDAAFICTERPAVQDEQAMLAMLISNLSCDGHYCDFIARRLRLPVDNEAASCLHTQHF